MPRWGLFVGCWIGNDSNRHLLSSKCWTSNTCGCQECEGNDSLSQRSTSQLHRDLEQNLIVMSNYADSNATSHNCGNKAITLKPPPPSKTKSFWKVGKPRDQS